MIVVRTLGIWETNIKEGDHISYKDKKDCTSYNEDVRDYIFVKIEVGEQKDLHGIKYN